MRAIALILCAGACGRIGFDDDRQGLTASIDARSGFTFVEIDARVEFASIDPNALTSVPIALPTELVFELPKASGPLRLVVTARDLRGRVVEAEGSTEIVVDSPATVSVVIGDAIADACLDGTTNGTESGIDCGGACPACSVGEACGGPADCATGTCVGSVCEPASGPPSWRSIPDMPFPREALAAARGADGRIYFFGGALDDNIGTAADVMAFDVETGWTVLPSLVSARERLAGVSTSDGTLFALGGESGNAGRLATVERYNGTGWLGATTMLRTRSHFSAAADLDDVVYAIGGLDAGGVAGATVEAFSGGAWTFRKSLPLARSNTAAARATDGRILAIGGHDGLGTTFFSTVSAYDPAIDDWAMLPSLGVARSDLTAVTGPDGRVYAMGGYVGAAGIKTVEAYRLGAASWVLLPPLSAGRDASAAVVGADGRIYVGGGRETVTAHASVEVYGPIFALASAVGAPGDTVTIDASNFAANATVRIYFDETPVELATTDAVGTAAGTTFRVPLDASTGAHAITAVDQRSRYPVRVAFTVR